MKHKVAILCLAVLFLTLQLVHPSRLMAQQDSTLLVITPDRIDTKVGQSFTISLQAQDASDLYGFQLDLAYTPGVLKVDEVTFNQQEEFTEILKDIDNDQGMASLAATLTGEREGLDGSVAMVDVQFTVIDQGDVDIKLENVKLSNSQARAISFEIAPFTVNNDNSPPSIQTLNSIDNNTLEIVFDEPVNYSENLNPDNFSIEYSKPGYTGYLDIEDIQFGSSNSIILTTAPQTGARFYQLKIENIRDGLFNMGSIPQMVDFIGHPKIEIQIENQPYSNNNFYVSVNLGNLDNFKQMIFRLPFDKEKIEFISRCSPDDPLHGNLEPIVNGDDRDNSGKENEYGEIRYNARIKGGVSPMDVMDVAVARFLFEAKEPPQDLTINFERMKLICDDPGGGDIVFSTDPDPQKGEKIINLNASSFSILKGHTLTTNIDCYGGQSFLTLKWLGDRNLRDDVSREGTAIEVPDLIPGDYELSITNPGYLTYNQQITINDDLHIQIKLIAGDVNGENGVDIIDLIQIAKSLNVSKGQGKYSIALDLNRDDIIDIYDVVLAARNFGSRAYEYGWS